LLLLLLLAVLGLRISPSAFPEIGGCVWLL